VTDESAPPVLGVAPLDPGEEPPAPDLDPIPDLDVVPALDKDGRKVLAQVLRMEGEIVRALRGIPPEEPEAWRWTDDEISALMPALSALTERYGMAAAINANAPHAGAAIAVVMHANRSLAAERAWRAASIDTEPEEPPTDEYEPADQPAGDEPAGQQPGTSLGPSDLAGVARRIAPGVTGGPR